MAFTHAFQKLSLIGKRRDEGHKSGVSSPKSDQLPGVTRSATTATAVAADEQSRLVGSTDRLPQAKCSDSPRVKAAMRFDTFHGPCATKKVPTVTTTTTTTTTSDTRPPGGGCVVPECDSINTFLRPDNLLMGDVHVKMDQTRPYLVGNKLMREIPLRDTSKILNDRELRCLHWVIGESVERHGTGCFLPHYTN